MSTALSLTDVMEDYFQHIKVELGLSERTCVGYRSWGRHFLRWLTENVQPEPTLEDFTTANLKRYLYYLAAGKRRPRTIRGAFFPLKGLGQFLVEMGALAEDPCAAIKLPKLDAARRELVTDDEVRALLAACDRQADRRKAALCRAIVSVLVFAGLRRSECLDLRVSDINLAEKSILVQQGKGMKSRVVYPHSECLAALRDWLALRPRECSHDYLFALDRSRRVHEVRLMKLLEEVKAIAGLAGHGNIKPHSLRHNCATRLMKNGADIRAIQSFLGHSQLSTTAVYLHTDEARLKEISALGSLDVGPKSKPSEGNLESPKGQFDRASEKPRCRSLRRTSARP